MTIQQVLVVDDCLSSLRKVIAHSIPTNFTALSTGKCPHLLCDVHADLRFPTGVGH